MHSNVKAPVIFDQTLAWSSILIINLIIKGICQSVYREGGGEGHDNGVDDDEDVLWRGLCLANWQQLPEVQWFPDSSYHMCR